MYIVGWHIEGFGIFRDFALRDLPSGMVVFEGPNEAGKSTLLAFLRAVLFGFRARGRGSVYEPLKGGNHGGRVFLATRQGAITVERFYRKPARIQLEDGTLLSEPEFQQLLGGLDHQTFSSVFAFSLDELSSFESIGSEQVSARIFAAGLSGAGPSVRDVMTRFEKTQEQLLRPRSQEGEINRLVHEIAVTERELREARQLALSYPRLVEEDERLAAEIRELTSQEREISQALEETKLLCSAWEIQADLLRCKQELTDLPLIDWFPPQARERLADIKGRLRDGGERQEQLAAKVSSKEHEIEALNYGLDTRLLEHAQEVRQLAEELQLHTQQRQEKLRLEAEWQERAQALRRVLDQLGPGVDEEHLARIDVSVAARQQLRGFRDDLARLNEALIKLRAQLETAKQRAASLEEEMTAKEPAGDSEAEARRKKVREISGFLKEAGTLAQDWAKARTGLENLRVLQHWQERAAKEAARKRRQMLYVIGPVLAAVVVGLVLAATLGGVKGTERVYLLVIGLAVVVFVLAVMLFGLRGAWDGGGSVGAGAFASPVDLEEGRGLEDKCKELDGRLLEIASAAGVEIQAASDGWPISLVSALEEKLVEAEREVTRLEEHRKTFAQLQKDLEAALGHRAQASEAFKQAQQELNEREQTFRSWLVANGMPGTLSPEAALDFLALAERGREAREECARLRQQIKTIDEQLALWEKRAQDVLTQAGVEPETTGVHQVEDKQLDLTRDRLTRAILMAKVRLDEAEELQTKLRSAEAALADLRQDLDRTTATLEMTEEELHQLLAEGRAGDEAEFLERLDIFEKRQKLKERIQELEAQLTKRLGLDERARTLRQELEQGKVEAWTQTAQTLERELEELKERRDALHMRSGELKEQLRGLENSANIAELENKLLQLEATLAQAIDRWYVAGVATTLLRSTLARYTEDRQPQVLAEASELFGEVTAGRYARVMALPDRNELVVLDSAGRQKNPGELSRGTAEQLYLCLRMGLAHEFSRHAEPLPIVMDDVLVNFDPRRRRAMAKLLLNFASSHQLLLFTCHPDITEVLLELEPSLRVERMDYDHTGSSV